MVIGPETRTLVADYYEEADREFYHNARTDIPKLLAYIRELEKKNRILTAKTTNSLANNLCPDHRDKIQGKRCLMCRIEELNDMLSVRWFMQNPEEAP
ncbi:MAG: hypothetical protein GJU73_05205 [Ferrovum sp.]|nr:hypothetical protein [Ferrovum sp.]